MIANEKVSFVYGANLLKFVEKGTFLLKFFLKEITSYWVHSLRWFAELDNYVRKSLGYRSTGEQSASPGFLDKH